MSAREWKPGDVALVRLDAETEIRVMRTREGHDGWRGVKGTFYDLHLSARPLVVIDPEDREQVERLVGVVHHVDPHGIEPHDIDEMQAALREFANPKPPKPEEPTGLGAVVEAINDNHFVRVGSAGWVHVDDDGGNPCDWEDIAVVRVLSEGVQP